MADPVFKGMTRSPMWWGVPVQVAIVVHIPFLVVSLYIMAFAGAWQSALILALVLPNHLVMREITRWSPQVWRKIGLHFHFRIVHRDRSWKFWQSSTYGPG